MESESGGGCVWDTDRENETQKERKREISVFQLVSSWKRKKSPAAKTNEMNPAHSF